LGQAAAERQFGCVDGRPELFDVRPELLQLKGLFGQLGSNHLEAARTTT